MPYCLAPRCPVKVDKGYCVDHQPQKPSAKMFTYRWRLLRALYLQAHPLCVVCEQQGQVTAATDVDHIEPHRGDPALFWNQENWQSLCHSCHSRKTASGK